MSSDFINDSGVFEDYSTFGKGNYVIRVCSFNVNSKFNKNENYEKWLHSENSADILVVGLQELYFKLTDIIAPQSSSLFKNNNKKSIIIDAHRKWINLFQSIKSIKENYILKESKSFAALCIFVFIKKSQLKTKNKIPSISNVMFGSLPLGILGMANKGGLSISFRFNDLSLCFINCHFPSGNENQLKRQQSMQSIIQKLQLNHKNEKSKKLNFIESEFDLVFLFGDLNFRLQNLSSEFIINQIKKENFFIIENLLKFDELILNKKYDCLYNWFYEAQINFFPTYKFIINSNDYNLKRIPSYCDRILWMGNKCVNISYCCHREIKMSDHKPISADFFIDNTIKSKRISKDFTKLKIIPRVKIENTKINFGKVYFYTNHFSETKLENIGTVTCEIIFKNIRSSQKMPTWFTIIPMSFILKPKEFINVQFRIFIDTDNVKNFNQNKENINCAIIYASVNNGASIAIQFQGEYQLSLFGIHLDYFQFFKKPIQKYTFSDIEQFERLKNEQSFIVCPKQKLLKRIIRLLMPKIKIFKSFSELILTQESDIVELIQLINIISSLDITTSFSVLKQKTFNEGTYIETLLIFLKCLPQPIIPFVIQARLAANPTNSHHVLKILHNLPETNILVIRKISKYFNAFKEHDTEVEFCANFLVSLIPPSSAALKEPLISVMSFLIQKPQML